jgi:hypothetical protein
MNYNNLSERILREQEEGYGLEPILREFIWDVSILKAEEQEERKSKITRYYQAIYGRTHNLKQAYNITKNWCNKIFVSTYIGRIIKNV